MAQATQAKKLRKTYRVNNKEIYRHLAVMARSGKHKQAVELAKSIFFVQIGKTVRRSLTSEEAAALIVKGMS